MFTYPNLPVQEAHHPGARFIERNLARVELCFDRPPKCSDAAGQSLWIHRLHGWMTGDESPESKEGLDVTTGQRMSSVWGIDDDSALLIGGETIRSGKAIAAEPFSASRDDVTSRAPGPSGIARAAPYVGAKSSEPVLDDFLDVLQTGREVVAGPLVGKTACLEDLHEAQKEDAIVTIEEAKGRGQTALSVRLSNWLRELGMARLTCIQAKTGTPKREDQPFVKG